MSTEPAPADLLALAARCEAGAAELEREALAAPDRPADPARSRYRLEQAALVAWETAADLRRQVAGDTVPIRTGHAQAELIATAAHSSGVLPDDGRHRAAIESTGMFGRLGRRWMLGAPTRPATCTCPCDHDGGCLVCGCVCDDPGACPCCNAPGSTTKEDHR